MRPLTLLTALSSISSITAAPALVWTQDSNAAEARSKEAIHSSDVMELPSLLSSTLSSSNTESSLTSVLFLVNHHTEDKDGLTALTQSGALPKVSSHYTSPSSSSITVHHAIHGIENAQSVTHAAKSVAGQENVLTTTLEEFQTKLPAMKRDRDTESTSVYADGRAHAIVNRQLVIVKVGEKSSMEALDEVVSEAIESEVMGSVILTAVRSRAEVELERNLLSQASAAAAAAVTASNKKNKNGRPQFNNKNSNKNNRRNHRRRLEDVDGEQNDEDNDNDYTGVYFVHMTPNILSGLLFGAFFLFVALIGIGQLGNISSQDCYVDTYPVVGREN